MPKWPRLLAIRVARRLNSNDAIDILSNPFILCGPPTHIRSDNGQEFIAKAVQAWITGVGAQTTYITRQRQRFWCGRRRALQRGRR